MQGRCEDCLWLLEGAATEISGAPTCLAFFPEPIPEEIATGDVFHDTVRDDQTQPLVFRKKEMLG